MKLFDVLSTSAKSFRNTQVKGPIPRDVIEELLNKGVYTPQDSLMVKDLFNTDWSVEEEKLTLTWVQIKEALGPFCLKYKGDSGNVYYDTYNLDIKAKRRLGFKE